MIKKVRIAVDHGNRNMKTWRKTLKFSQRMSFRWIFRLGCHPSIMQNFVNGMKHILKDKGKSMISITVVGHIISPLER